MIFHAEALSGLNAVITGGCGGIGVYVVKKLTDHGANVTVNDLISASEAQSIFTGAHINPDRVAYFQGDATQPETVEDLVGYARQRFGKIDVALCHAGIVQVTPILEYSAADWDRLMAVNLRSAFLLAQNASRAMVEDKVNGQLIFTSSWVGQVPWPQIGPYNASKAALVQLMRSFARELADKGIRANAIAPGIVEVGMAKREWDTNMDYRARVQKAIPLGHMQPPESVADSFVFLCSKAATYMTGAVLLVDGGCSLYPMD